MPRRFESVGDRMPKWEPAPGRELWALSDPRLSNPSQGAKEVLLWSRKNLGQYSSPSLFSTHFSHTTNITVFENKVCEIHIYINKCICSFVEVVIIGWLCSRVYLYTRGIQHFRTLIKHFWTVIQHFWTVMWHTAKPLYDRPIH